MTASSISEPIVFRDADRRVWIMIAVVFTVALIIRLACFTGLIASDDLGYAEYAQQISQGTYNLEPHHYAIRYGVLVPLAAVYRLFGVHEWTTVILPVISSSLAAALVAMFAARFSGHAEAWIASLLMATFPVDVRYASVLVPEAFLAALLLAGASLFVLAETQESIIFGLTAGFVLGLSYLTKEPGAFVAVAFIVFALLRKQWRLALAVASGMALVVAAEMAWYLSQSGDLLFRLHAMGIHNSSPMVLAANEKLSYRLWKSYPRMMLVPSIDFGLHSLLALGLASVALFWERCTKTVLMLLWASVPFLYLNFGTSSFRSYLVLPAAPRYIGLVYPPLFVLASVVLVRWVGHQIKRKIMVGATVTLVCIVGIACAATTRQTGYRTEHVKHLRMIAEVARRDRSRICKFAGPDGTEWRQVLEIIGRDRLGCDGPSVLQILPDQRGLPITTRR